MVALNAKLKRDSGSEPPNWKEMVALNAETKKDDSERRTEKNDSERRTENRWWLWTMN